MMKITIESDNLDNPMIFECDFVALTMDGRDKTDSLAVGHMTPETFVDVITEQARLSKAIMNSFFEHESHPLTKLIAMKEISRKLHEMTQQDKEGIVPDNIEMNTLYIRK